MSSRAKRTSHYSLSGEEVKKRNSNAKRYNIGEMVERNEMKSKHKPKVNRNSERGRTIRDVGSI